MKFIKIVVLNFCLLIFSSATWAVGNLAVTRITPAGNDVAQIDQIVIEFNRPVVPLGRMDRRWDEVPVMITPEVKCQWRWLATNTLACQLDEKDQLKLATEYTVTVNREVKAIDGSVLQESYKQQFVTQRPDITNIWLANWLAPNKPVIQVAFNQGVTEKSLIHHLFFYAKKSHKHIAVHVQPDPEVTDPHDQGQHWLVMPEQGLPVGKEITLIMEEGIQSKVGAEASLKTKDLLTFYTFPRFKFVGLSCTNVQGREILITEKKAQRDIAAELCDPLASVSLRFTVPVAKQEFKQHITFQPVIKINTPEPAEEPSEQLLSNVHPDKDSVFDLPIWPDTPLKGLQEYTVSLQSNVLYSWWAKLLSYVGIKPKSAVVDVFGRHLSHPLFIHFKTGHRKPNYVLPYNFAILEKQSDSDVPLYVTNLQSLKISYDKLTSAGLQTQLQQQRLLPQVADLQFAIPLNIRQLLDGKSGLVALNILTQPKVGEAPANLLVEVTPYQVQAKIGHFNSLVWVTDFTSGLPVANATVNLLYTQNFFPTQQVKAVTTAQTDANGLALLPGTVQLDAIQKLPNSDWLLQINKAQDMAWLPLNYAFQVNGFRMGDIDNTRREKYGHMVTWGTTAQGIYRPGDTVQYKIYVRDQNIKNLTLPPLKNYQLAIKDPAGKTVDIVKNIQLDAFGSLQGQYVIPKQAVAGWYEFYLSNDFSKETWQPLRVLITDFTPAAFKVSNQLNGAAFSAGESVEVTTRAKLYAGGSYGNANMRLTAAIVPKTFATTNPSIKAFDFYQIDAEHAARVIYQKILLLDKTGENQAQFKLEAHNINYGKLSIESAVQDERGKYVVAHTQVDYFGVDRFLGWHPKQWMFTTGKPAQVDFVVVDTKGNMVTNTNVHITIEHEVYQAARVKSAGEVYTSEFKQSWQQVGTCTAISQTTAPQVCEFVPQQAGNYRLTAKFLDSKGIESKTSTAVWVSGSDYVVWNQDNDAALAIIPEKTVFQIGEAAKFLIKNPYPGALALITIERYGVIDQWVQKLADSTPIITVPIKPDYLPGFYLSVSVFSPRVEPKHVKPIEVGQLDLAKPTARFGYFKVNVDDPHKQLFISANTDRKVYKPGETVQLDMQVTSRKEAIAPVELAVAVVDASVLDLLHDANKHYDIYHGLYQLADLDVVNYSLLDRLVGRQKFEKKGATPGGDGGAAFSMRSLFKYVSYWNPSVVVDAAGKAQVSFRVPDNLTRWQVIILGITKTDQMGTGTTDFAVNQPTELRPVMPNHVFSGDRFMAGFSVTNRLPVTRTLTVAMQATGALNSKLSTLHYQTKVTLQPFQRQIVTMPLVANEFAAATETAAIILKANAGDARDQDSLLQTIPVEPLAVLETNAIYGTADKDIVQQLVAVPKNINPQVGSVSFSLSPTIIGNIEGVFRYARDYPYACWEQKLTQALLAAKFKILKAYLAPTLQWQESAQLPEKILKEAVNFQANNGGMTYFTATDQYTDPYLSAYTALAFHWLKQQGYIIPETVSQNLTTYLQSFLRQDRARDFYTQSMTATVRAVALAALAATQTIQINDLDRLRDYLPNMSLFGLANYLQAALHVPKTESLQQILVDKIMTYAQQAPDKITFTETLDNDYARILASPLRDTCAVLTALLDYQQAHPQANLQAQSFKIVRGIIQARGERDHWENTQENFFCTNALARYSQTYETQTPKMQLAVSMNAQKIGEGELQSLQAPPLNFTHQLALEDIGKKMVITLQRKGVGRYYYNTRLQYVPLDLLSKDENHGIEIHREYSVQRNSQWILLDDVSNTLKQGELVRVDLYLSLIAPRNFVVVNDSVPGGLEPVNTQLATSSIVDANDRSQPVASGSLWFKFNDWSEYNASFWNFYHEEIRNDAVRFYADHLEPGHYHLSYVAQAISSGEFTSLPSLAQEMYAPEVNGKTRQRKLVVQ